MSKRIPYKIIDLEKLAVAYPEIVTEETVVRRIVDKEKLYKLVKLHNELGRQIEGVEIGSQDAAELSVAEPEPEPETPAFLNKGSK